MEDAKSKGLSKSHFSFLTAQGRCPACEGMGRTRISMDFMPDVYQECEVCSGKRFRPEVLEVLYKGKNIADVLESEVSEAATFFADKLPIRNILISLSDAGLSYLKLGQALNTLSGGEARRLNLCRMLITGYKMQDAGSLFLFDEPSTGLHFADIENLLKLFHRLADQGNTLIIIEHDQQIIREADYIIELGPEGGEKGGCLVTG